MKAQWRPLRSSQYSLTQKRASRRPAQLPEMAHGGGSPWDSGRTGMDLLSEEPTLRELGRRTSSKETGICGFRELCEGCRGC